MQFDLLYWRRVVLCFVAHYETLVNHGYPTSEIHNLITLTSDVLNHVRRIKADTFTQSVLARRICGILYSDLGLSILHVRGYVEGTRRTIKGYKAAIDAPK